jgi:hypothetical protein
MKEEQELRCCLYCGRDTRSKSQICYRCVSGNNYLYSVNGIRKRFFNNNNSQINETKGRKVLPIPFDKITDDDLEYMDYYKDNVTNSSDGDKAIEEFAKRKNKNSYFIFASTKKNKDITP